MIDCVSQTSAFWCQQRSHSLKTPRLSPGVTQLWQPEWFQTPLIDILNVAWKCRALQDPSSQEYICPRVGCQTEGHFLQKAKHHAFISSKHRGVFPPLPSDLRTPSRGTAAVSSEPYSKHNPGGSIMQMINLRATKQLPSILGSCCVNGWQEKPRRIGLQERAAIYLFIFLPV